MPKWWFDTLFVRSFSARRHNNRCSNVHEQRSGSRPGFSCSAPGEEAELREKRRIFLQSFLWLGPAGLGVILCGVFLRYGNVRIFDPVDTTIDASSTRR